MSHWPNHFIDSEDPYIVHFLSHRKPWTTLSANRFRQLWWAFHDMDYSQVLSHHMGDFQIEMDPDYELHLFNLTTVSYTHLDVYKRQMLYCTIILQIIKFQKVKSFQRFSIIYLIGNHGFR